MSPLRLRRSGEKAVGHELGPTWALKARSEIKTAATGSSARALVERRALTDHFRTMCLWRRGQQLRNDDLCRLRVCIDGAWKQQSIFRMAQGGRWDRTVQCADLRARTWLRSGARVAPDKFGRPTNPGAPIRRARARSCATTAAGAPGVWGGKVQGAGPSELHRSSTADPMTRPWACVCNRTSQPQRQRLRRRPAPAHNREATRHRNPLNFGPSPSTTRRLQQLASPQRTRHRNTIGGRGGPPRRTQLLRDQKTTQGAATAPPPPAS